MFLVTPGLTLSRLPGTMSVGLPDFFGQCDHSCLQQDASTTLIQRKQILNTIPKQKTLSKI
jgi:hypothetical protein